MTKPTALIVDDEPHARAKLRRLLEQDGRMDIAGEARDGLEAVAALETVRPHTVFLDVQMPGLDGFGVLDALDPTLTPHVVFVTAHDAHALRAFDVHAVDYLLKPVDPDRFVEAVDRALEAPRRGGLARSVRASLPPERQIVERFLVRVRGRMILVPVERVEYISAAGNYAELHAGKEVHLVRGTLQELEDRLPEMRFRRIHRSTIVNLDHVQELQPWSHGDLTVVLRSGTELRLSRRYRERLHGVFGP